MGLKEEFSQELENTIKAAKKKDYIPTYFIKMLDEYGEVETARKLLAKKEPQTGLFELYHLDLLHESMEAVVIKGKYQSLFTKDEIAEAKRRLEDLRYNTNN